LQVQLVGGVVVDPVVPSTVPEEPPPRPRQSSSISDVPECWMSPARPATWRRRAACSGCRVRRSTRWRSVAERYGVEALLPKDRRVPQMPKATPTWVLNELLTLAVVEPTLGCRQYADSIGDRGYQIAKSTVQEILVRHSLGRRSQRVARVAAVAALTTTPPSPRCSTNSTPSPSTPFRDTTLTEASTRHAEASGESRCDPTPGGQARCVGWPRPAATPGRLPTSAT
jgi:hypothetical protein